MKRNLLALIITLTMAFAVAGVAGAAGSKATSRFDGAYSGTVAGHRGSEASLTLDLAQSGRTVSGVATLGSGLKVNAGGLCGVVTVPATTFDADAIVSSRNPRRLLTASRLDVGGGITVKISVDGTLSADSDTLDVTATVDTPFLCGRDPVITGRLIASS